jgi:hypothetical protein
MPIGVPTGEISEEKRAYNKAYQASPSGKAARKKYYEGAKGQALRRRQQAAREESYLRIAALKAKGRCADCTGQFPPVCMDYDHRDPTEKTLCVSELISNNASWEVVEAEIAKCDLVCANCHRIRTYPQRKEIDV